MAGACTDAPGPRDTGYISGSASRGLVPESPYSGAPLGQAECVPESQTRMHHSGRPSASPSLSTRVHHSAGRVPVRVSSPPRRPVAGHSGAMSYSEYDWEATGVRQVDRKLSRPTRCEADPLGEGRPEPGRSSARARFPQGDGAWVMGSGPYQRNDGFGPRYQAGATGSAGPHAQSTPPDLGGGVSARDHLCRGRMPTATRGRDSTRVGVLGRNSEAEYEPSAKPAAGYNMANLCQAAVGHDCDQCRPRAGQG